MPLKTALMLLKCHYDYQWCIINIVEHLVLSRECLSNTSPVLLPILFLSQCSQRGRLSHIARSAPLPWPFPSAPSSSSSCRTRSSCRRHVVAVGAICPARLVREMKWPPTTCRRRPACGPAADDGQTSRTTRALPGRACLAGRGVVVDDGAASGSTTGSATSGRWSLRSMSGGARLVENMIVGLR